MTAVLKVLLFLLKCIGILLLVILGLLLVTVLLVLLAPVRYKGKLDKKEAPEEIFRADGLVSWLNPFLRVRIRYTEKKLHYTVRIFGLCLLNSDKPKKEKKKKEKKKKKTKKKQHAVVITLTETEPVGVPAEPDNESNYVPEAAEEMTADSNSVLSADVGAGETENSGAEEEKKSLFTKIKGVYEKIKNIPALIKQKITKFINIIKLLWYKKEKTIAFLEDELHRTAMGTAWNTVKQVLRHVLPGKIKGYVEFGTGDPESTGKALGVLGIMYAWYGKGVTIVPDFYEKRVVAELFFKGRIRFGTLLIKGLRLIRDKHVKRFIKNFKKLLKILKQKAE